MLQEMINIFVLMVPFYSCSDGAWEAAIFIEMDGLNYCYSENNVFDGFYFSYPCIGMNLKEKSSCLLIDRIWLPD
jgi:hypothetical protein